MPVTLAMAATDRWISAHRITKVRPTAMIPVTEIWVRMLAALSSEAKDRLVRLKKATSAISVANGAMMRIWLRRKTAIAVMSRRLQELVLAHGLAGEFPHDPPFLHHYDAVGQGQHGLGLGRQHDDAHPLLAQALDDAHDVLLGTDIHAARRLAQHQHLGRPGQPLGERHL